MVTDLPPALSIGSAGAAVTAPTSPPDGVLWRKGMAVNARRFPGLPETASAFGNHVPHVIELRSEKKVCGIHARGVVALMEYVKPIRDRSVRSDPGKAVGAGRDESVSFPHRKTPIAKSGAGRTVPRPAPRLNLYSTPESHLIGESNVLSRHRRNLTGFQRAAPMP